MQSLLENPNTVLSPLYLMHGWDSWYDQGTVGMIMHGEILICKHVFFSHRARAHASGQPATRAHALCMWILHDSWIRSCTKIARALANAIELIN